MKICTACNASYSDETLSFCPVDGTTLTPQKEISLEQVPFSYEPGSWSETGTSASSAADSFNYSEPPVAAAFSQPPPSAPQNHSPAPAKNANRGSIFPVVVGSIAIAVFAVLLLSLISGGSRSGVKVTRANGDIITLANGASVRAEPQATPMSVTRGKTAVVTNAPPAANTSGASNSATAANGNVTGKPISRNTNFTGIWTGKFNEEPAVLSLTTQNGDHFSGTLSKKGYIIKVSGKIDFEKGSVAITETKVLQTPPNLNWYLGTNDGVISEGGKSMSGTGRDKNGSYLWSFTKD